MRLFKNYKKLYESTKNNLKVMQERNADLYERCIVYQEQAKDHEKKLKEKIAKLSFELEDTQGFLEQEKACSEALRKERTKLKTKLTKVINALAEYNLDEAMKFNKQLGKEEKKGGNKNGR